MTALFCVTSSVGLSLNTNRFVFELGLKEHIEMWESLSKQ